MEPVRSTIAAAIRSRVAGPNARTVVHDIIRAEGERWFERDRPIWAVHTDAAMFVGGLRALLFQSLHPLAMAGVADHSDYRGDPWGILQRTSIFFAGTIFGTAGETQRGGEKDRGIHRRVHWVETDGTPYAVSLPSL